MFGRAKPRDVIFIVAVLIATGLLVAKWRNGAASHDASLRREVILTPDGGIVGQVYDHESPSAYAVMYREAVVLLEREDFTGAERIYRQLLTLEPARAAPHYGLAGALVKQQRYAEARPHYEHALAVDARSLPALYGLGLCSLHDDDLGSAATYFDRALAIDPRDASSLSSASQARARMGQCAEADALAARWRQETKGATAWRTLATALDELLSACRDDASRSTHDGADANR